MKNLKKIILLILITILFSINYGNVSALQVKYNGYTCAEGPCDGQYGKNDRMKRVANIFTSGSNNNAINYIDFYDYRFVAIDDKGNKTDYVGYCEDPGFATPGWKNKYGQSGAIPDMKAEKIDPNESAYYAGLYAILANGGKINSSNDDKIGTEMAIRSYIYGIFFQGKAGTPIEQRLNVGTYDAIPAKVSAYINYGIDFVSKNYLETMKQIIEKDKISNLKTMVSSLCSEVNKNCLINIAQKKYSSTYNENYKFVESTLNSQIPAAKAKADKLLDIAMKAVIDFYQRDLDGNGTVNKNDQVKIKITRDKDKEEEIKDSRKKDGEEYLAYSIKIDKIPDFLKVNNFKLDCPNCEKNGITFNDTSSEGIHLEYQIVSGKDKGKWNPLTAGVNLAKHVNDKNIAYIRIIYTRKNINDSECNDVNFSITYDVTDMIRQSKNEAYLLIYEANVNVQHYTVFIGSDNSDNFIVGSGKDELKDLGMISTSIDNKITKIKPLCNEVCKVTKYDKDGKAVEYVDNEGKTQPWNSEKFEETCGCTDKPSNNNYKYRLSTTNANNYAKSLHKNSIFDNYNRGLFTNDESEYKRVCLQQNICKVEFDDKNTPVGYYDATGKYISVSKWDANASQAFENACGCSSGALSNGNYRLPTTDLKVKWYKTTHPNMTDNYKAGEEFDKNKEPENYEKYVNVCCDDNDPNKPNCPKTHVCEKVDDVYYGPDGEKLNNEQEYLNKCCDNPDIPDNPPECPTPTCDSTFTPPICSDDESQSKASFTAVPNGDIKKCVIEDGKDSAGNSYKLQESNSNKYCSAYCKEDYSVLQFNKKIEGVKCGSYMKLTAKISGSQDCYIAYNRSGSDDKSINIDQFKIDLADLSARAEEASRKYQSFAKASVSHYYHCDGDTTPYNTQVNCTIETDEKDENGNPITKTEKSVEHWRIKIGDEYSLAYSGYTTEAAANKVIDDHKAAAKKIMEDSASQINIAIVQIQDCTNGTLISDKEFKFDQSVYWEYDESYNELLSKEDREMKNVGSVESDSTGVKFCTEDVNDSFECNNWKTTENINQTRYSYLSCDTTGCKNATTEPINNVKYVYKRDTKSQSYESKDNIFYQVPGSGPGSGYVSTQSKYTYDNRQFNNIPIKGLPIDLDYALDAGEQAHNFTMWIEDLGEFYDTGETGRILDTNGDHEKNSIVGYDNYKLWPETKFTQGKGKYICQYISDCTECPTCEFECQGDFCTYVDDKCPNCNYECINCIYSLGDLRLYFKPVSTTNFDSADRTYGYNWDIKTQLENLPEETKNQLKDVQEKAQSVIDEITASNADLYSDDNLDAKFVLNGSDINWFKQYNSKKVDEGGYNNLSLESYDVGGYTVSFSTCLDDFFEENPNNESYIKDRPNKNDRNLANIKKYYPSYQGYNAESINIGGAYK